MYQTICFEVDTNLETSVQEARVGFFMHGNVTTFKKDFSINSLLDSVLDKSWEGEVYLESVGGQVCKALYFENRAIKRAYVMHWVRTSYHEKGKTPILYVISFEGGTPQVKLYRMEDEQLQFVHLLSMESVEKREHFEVYRCFQGTPIEISLTLFKSSKQTAISVRDRLGAELMDATTAEAIGDSIERLEAFLEFSYYCHGFQKLSRCIEFQIRDLIEHLGGAWDKAVSLLRSRALYIHAVFDLKYRLVKKGCSLACQRFLEEVVRGKKITRCQRLTEQVTLLESDRLSVIFRDRFDPEIIKQYQGREDLFVEVLSGKPIEGVKNYFQVYEKEGRIVYYNPKVEGALENLHPFLFEELEIWMFERFDLVQDLGNSDLENTLIYATAKKQPGPAARVSEVRLIGFSMVYDSFEEGIKNLVGAMRKSEQESYFNRMIFHVHSKINEREVKRCLNLYLGQIKQLNVEKVIVKCEGEAFEWKNLLDREPQFSKLSDAEEKKLISTASSIELRELMIRKKGGVWAYRIPQLIDTICDEFRKNELKMEGSKEGEFVELDLDYTKNVIDEKTGDINYNFGELIPVKRPVGNNEAGVVIGIKTDDLGIGVLVRRVVIFGDLSHASRGSIRAQECARINAAIRYAANEGIPVDWYTASFGVQVHREKGVEGLDAAAATVREIVKNCHHKNVPINLIIDETNIGAQSYWDSLATIINETTGILIMTPKGCMSLTGPGALVSALYRTVHSSEVRNFSKKLYPKGLQSLSGHELVHGPNSDSMLLAPDIKEATQLLIKHHYYSYFSPEEKLASARPLKEHDEELDITKDSIVHQEVENFLKGLKPDRETIIEYLRDDFSPESLQFWKDVKGVKGKDFKQGDLPQEPSTIVKEMLIGGQPTMVIFTATGPLTPTDSEIIARAIYKANGRMQVLIIGSLSGFGCDPLSMENRQLLTGSFIAKAIVDHQGPLLIVNLGSLVGGTFVVFNKQLNPHLKILAIEGARVQVLGGMGAAKVVFHSQIVREADQDSRVLKLAKKVPKSDQKVQRVSQKRIKEITNSFEGERKKVIEEIEDREAGLFDQYHNAQRAVAVGSIDAVIPFKKLKSSIIETFAQMREEYLKDVSSD